MHSDFMRLAQEASRRCQVHFGADCLAGYLHGSVRTGDALAGVSDLDYMLILCAEPSPEALCWLKETSCALKAEFPVAAEVHLSPCTLEELRGNAFARFALHHNAMRCFGRDVLSTLAEEGYPAPESDAAFAKGRLDFARHCFTQALRGDTPDCTGSLPREEWAVVRKFARYFVVIEGAYCLMSRGEFRSFLPDDVLPSLAAAFPEEAGRIRWTHAMLEDPRNAGLSRAEYLQCISPLVQRMFTTIQNA